MDRMRYGAILLIAMVLGATSPLYAVETSPAEPRPISAAERAATQIVVKFLAEGPAAIRSELASSSPWTSLPEQAALNEIEARTGPHRNVKWILETAVPSLAR